MRGLTLRIVFSLFISNSAFAWSDSPPVPTQEKPPKEPPIPAKTSKSQKETSKATGPNASEARVTSKKKKQHPLPPEASAHEEIYEDSVRPVSHVEEVVVTNLMGQTLQQPIVTQSVEAPPPASQTDTSPKTEVATEPKSIDASTETLPESEEPPANFWTCDTMTGDWGGIRTSMAEHGFDLGIAYTADVFGVAKGGLAQKSSFIGDLDLTATADLEKLASLPGASVFVYFLGNHGLGNMPTSASEHVGDAQVVDNIDATPTFKLLEAWFLQDLFNKKLSVLVGLYNVNGEFDVSETGGLFMNGSFGMGIDFSQSGPSVYPVTAVGTRLRYNPTPETYLQTAILDGVPGDPEDPYGTHVSWNEQEGVMNVTELGIVLGKEEESTNPYSKFALGGWFFTSRFDDVKAVNTDGTPVSRSGNIGAYVLAEQVVWREEDIAQGLSLFGRFGFADQRVNQFALYSGIGAVYTGLVPSRDEDQMGFGIASAHVGDDYKSAQEQAGVETASAETTLEWTYRFAATPWLGLQLDTQYVIHPSADPTIPNAWVIGSRYELTL